jgi:hypothetical protein
MSQSRSVTQDELSPSRDEARKQFGDMLQRLRKGAGVSIEAVAYETKISKHFILSLETGKFDDLPGKVFGRGFIKSIGRYLRSDSIALLELYDNCWVDKVALKDAPAPAQEDKTRIQESLTAASRVASKISFAPRNRRLRLRLPTWLVRNVVRPEVRIGALAAIAGVMVVGVFGRWVTSRISRSPSTTVATSVTSVASVVVSPINSDAKKSSVPTALSDEALTDVGSEVAVPSHVVDKVMATDSRPLIVSNATTETSTSTGAMNEKSPLTLVGTPVAFSQTLELTVKKPTEIKLVVDGKRIQPSELAEGSHSFTFTTRADLSVSDASLIEVAFNGKPLGTLGGEGRRRKIQFQAKPTDLDFPH